jgi:hypothetical protein
MIDMTGPCRSTAKILEGVTDDQLGGPTPCEQLFGPVVDIADDAPASSVHSRSAGATPSGG